jgi:phage/plasmid-associated DNA primase
MSDFTHPPKITLKVQGENVPIKIKTRDVKTPEYMALRANSKWVPYMPMGTMSEPAVTDPPSVPIMIDDEEESKSPPRYLSEEIKTVATNMPSPTLTGITRPQAQRVPVIPVMEDGDVDLTYDECEVVALPDTTPSSTPVLPPDRGDFDITTQSEIARYMLPMVNVERVNIDIYWLDVGRALYTAHAGHDQGKNLWIQWTQSGCPLDMLVIMVQRCHDTYSSFKNNLLTVKTLGWYARLDNVKEYNQWHTAWCQEALTKSLSCLHDDVSQALYRVLWLDYICTRRSKNTWYKFSGVWKKQDDAHGLVDDINNNFIKVYDSMILDSHQQIYAIRYGGRNAVGGEGLVKSLELLVTQLSTLVKKLKTESYKCTLIKNARSNFYIEDFDKKVDVDPYKTGWSNCVVEICGGIAIPRPGKPEDYITMNTNIPIRSDLHIEHPLVQRLLVWLHQVFVDDELFHHACKDAASFLKRLNSEKYFRIWTGETDNSKSMFVKLYEATLGMYVFDFPIDILNVKALVSRGGPSPETAQSKNCTMGIMSEPDTGLVMSAGQIKRMRGGDSFFSRNCNEDGGKIKATYKAVLMCNRIPEISNPDRPTMNSLLIMPFLSTWVDNPPSGEEQQRQQRLFKKDENFENQIPELAEAFGWLMVAYYPYYAREGLKPPSIVQGHIRRHWEQRDMYQAFLMECTYIANKAPVLPGIKPEIDFEATVSPTELYLSFKSWFRDGHPSNEQPPARNLFIDQMSMRNRLGPLNPQRKWIGLKIVTPENIGRSVSAPAALTATNLETHNSVTEIPGIPRDEDLDSDSGVTTASERKNRDSDCKYVEEYVDSYYRLTNDPTVTPMTDLYQKFVDHRGSNVMRKHVFYSCLKSLYNDRSGRKNNFKGYRGFVQL